MYGVYAQRYNAAGVAQGGEFRVNTFTANSQSSSAVAMDADGDFVVTWESNQDGGGYGAYAQRYNAAGVAAGGEFRVNTFTTGNQRFPGVAADADGDMVVAWASNGQDGNDYGVYAQRYAGASDDASPFATGLSVAGAPVLPGGRVLHPTVTLAVAVSEELSAVGGAAGAASVTNPANWWLVSDSTGQNLNGLVTGITFGLNGTTNKYEATLTLSAPLTDGIYRLGPRPTVQDRAGNAFDGNPSVPGAQDMASQGFTVAPAVPLGPEVRVNTTTAGSQRVNWDVLRSVATDAAGNYVVTWGSDGQDGSGFGIYAQRYSAAGVPQGNEFRVNNYTTGNQYAPTVAVDADGDFVVTWTSDGQDGGGDGVFARRYSAAGVAQGTEFRVNAFTTSSQRNPAVAMDAAGDFVISWMSGGGQDGGGYGVYAQRYNAAGALQGGEFRVNSYTTGNQQYAAVAMDAAGDFVVAWSSVNQDGSQDGVYAQRYSAAGLVQGAEFRANTFTTGNQQAATVAMDADGDFVVAWSSVNQDGNSNGVYAQRFDAAGAARGSEFRVNTYTTNAQFLPAVAADAGGDFVVTWSSNAGGQEGGGYGLYAQRYNAAGDALGPEFRVNTYTTGAQRYASVAMDADGDFVVAWQSDGQDGSNEGVYARRFRGSAAPVVVETTFAGSPVLAGQALIPVTSLVVWFSEAMSVAGGTGGANSVTNPANWSLSRDGNDASGRIASVAYAGDATAGTYAATVSFTGTLPDGAYVLTAGTALRDLTGQSLDGNADGTAGDAYALSFTAYDPKAIGAEFRANTTTSGRQQTNVQSPGSVATDAAGNFVVAWTSEGQDSGTYGVYAQRYNAAGAAQGTEFRVNTYTTGSQRFGAVAMDADGDFVVTWTGAGGGDNYGIYAQRYNAAGVAQGGEFRVNAYATDTQRHSTVAMDADGDFVVAWASYTQDGSGSAVYAQRYDAAGVAQGAEFRVNAYTTNGQRRATVAMDADGDFVVTWSSDGQDGSNDGVYAQRYNAAGAAQGPEFRVNTETSGNQNESAVAMDADGDFVVTWTSSPQDGSNEGVYAQRYNAAGVAQGTESRVNVYTTSSQLHSAVATDAAGEFVVTWTSSGSQDGNSFGIYARRYDPAGVAQGGEFRVNAYTTGAQQFSHVAMDADGDFVIAWTSYGEDGSNDGVYAQRYGSFAPNAAPTTTGLSNLSVAENAPDAAVGLWAAFADDHTADADLTYAVVGNTTPGLFASAAVNTATGNLILDFAPAGTGSSVLTVRATDAGGLSVETSFTVTVVARPAVQSVAVNGGAGVTSATQRSKVRGLTVTFDRPVDLAAGALTVERSDGSAVPNVSVGYAATVVGGKTVATVTFTGTGLVDGGSLADGRYRLRVDAAKVTDPALANAAMSADYVLAFHRLYGDADGDGAVGATDVLGARTMLNKSSGQAGYRPELDPNESDMFTLTEYNALRARQGMVV